MNLLTFEKQILKRRSIFLKTFLPCLKMCVSQTQPKQSQGDVTMTTTGGQYKSGTCLKTVPLPTVEGSYKFWMYTFLGDTNHPAPSISGGFGSSIGQFTISFFFSSRRIFMKLLDDEVLRAQSINAVRCGNLVLFILIKYYLGQCTRSSFHCAR